MRVHHLHALSGNNASQVLSCIKMNAVITCSILISHCLAKHMTLGSEKWFVKSLQGTCGLDNINYF